MGPNMSKDKEPRRNEKEHKKQLAVANLKEILAKAPADQKSKHRIFIGTKTFTAEQLMREVEADTEEGKLIMEAVRGFHLEFKQEDRK
jgi:precorrin-6B methylase 2